MEWTRGFDSQEVLWAAAEMLNSSNFPRPTVSSAPSPTSTTSRSSGGRLPTNGVKVAPSRAKTKWNSILSEYRRISYHQNKSGNATYAAMTDSERRAAKLDPDFEPEWIDLLSSFLGRRPAQSPPTVTDRSQANPNTAVTICSYPDPAGLRNEGAGVGYYSSSQTSAKEPEARYYFDSSSFKGTSSGTLPRESFITMSADSLSG
ncbi:hypothetical protein R1flu_019671 [Riccia fluitans]|uniref:Uncharacterized protein n=1 Tax=Riccia fluitans TaxID=41844 RepID=A0ABD1ZJJ1_9MARC